MVFRSFCFVFLECISHFNHGNLYRSPFQNLSKFDMKLFRLAQDITCSGREFQSWTVLWLKIFLLNSSLHRPLNNFWLWPLLLLLGGKTKKLLGSSLSTPFIILNTWIISPRCLLKSKDGSFTNLSRSSYGRTNAWDQFGCPSLYFLHF